MLDLLKIIEDLNKQIIAGPTIGLIGTTPKYDNYQKLLNLIENTFFHNNANHFYSPIISNINIEDLNKMDLDLFEKIVNINNVEITRFPIFVRNYLIKNKGDKNYNQLMSKTESAKDFSSTEPILNYIQRKKNISFVIYLISEFSGRLCEYETPEQEFKRIRREKLEKLETV